MVPHRPAWFRRSADWSRTSRTTSSARCSSMPTTAALPVLRTAVRELRNQAEALAARGAALRRRGGRFGLRGHELSRPVVRNRSAAGRRLDRGERDHGGIAAAFHRQHAAIYEFADASARCADPQSSPGHRGHGAVAGFPHDRSRRQARRARSGCVSAWYGGESHACRSTTATRSGTATRCRAPRSSCRRMRPPASPPALRISVDEHGNLHLRLEA